MPVPFFLVSTEEILELSIPKLYNYLQEIQNLLYDNQITNKNITKDVASFISDTLRPTKKFIDFIVNFLPSAPPHRPHENAQHPWSKTKLKNSLSIIYDYRSNALHSGIPFPEPMCEPPFNHKD